MTAERRCIDHDAPRLCLALDRGRSDLDTRRMGKNIMRSHEAFANLWRFKRFVVTVVLVEVDC